MIEISIIILRSIVRSPSVEPQYRMDRDTVRNGLDESKPAGYFPQ